MRPFLSLLVFGLVLGIACDAEAGLLSRLLFDRQDVNVTVVNAGGRSFNATQFRSFDPRFSSRSRFANVRSINNLRLNSFQTRQFNAFGSRTFVDGHGNVFETDRLGNAIFRGNVRGLGIHGTGGRGFGGRTLRIEFDD